MIYNIYQQILLSDDDKVTFELIGTTESNHPDDEVERYRALMSAKQMFPDNYRIAVQPQ